MVGVGLPVDGALTTAAQVRALTAEEAGAAVPVRLRGIFMGDADPAGIAFVIQDETDGIYVQAAPSLVAGLSRGDVVEVVGVSNPGGYAPFVAAHEARVLGRGEIPEPIRLPMDDLNAGHMDAKWVEVIGTVRSVEPKTEDEFAQSETASRYVPSIRSGPRPATAKVKIELASGSARLMVEVYGALEPAEYVDAVVRLRGLCFNLHNTNRQFVRPLIQVPRGLGIEILSPPSDYSFDGKPRPVESLLRFEQTQLNQGHRVHVRGVVVHYKPGFALWLRDGDHSLQIETKLVDALEPGDEVDVLGFPVLGEYSPILEDAVFRKRSRQPTPMPVRLNAVSDVLHNDANLVQLEGRLTEVRHFPDSIELSLEWLGTTVRGRLLLTEPLAGPTDWLAGSIVRVAGVCAVAEDEPVPLGGLWMAHSFQLLLRSTGDLAIVKPAPWWNAVRIAWALSGVLVLSLGGIAAVMLASRRRLKDQERRRAMAESEFSAILNERNRVAREIHDTLSQSLGAISVQLELARSHAGELSDAVRGHMGIAHRLARGALSEARDSIWNMRSQVLEKLDLGGALAQILEQLTEGTGIEAEMKVSGQKRRLPPVVENNLLRIGQEAITNACKHARPRRIVVELAFERRSVRLRVEDDGIGFAVEPKPNAARRSFGLVGLRERADLMGGAVEIASEPGRGTRVEVRLSV